MKENIHKDQSVIPKNAYKHVKGSLDIDTIKRLKKAQIMPEQIKKITKKQLEFSLD